MNELHKEQNLKSLRMLDVKYIAGFFDGEGYATIIKQESRYYYVRVTISNKNKEVLELIQNMYGGKVNLTVVKNEDWADCYRLDIHTQQAIDFLNAIQPHIIVRKQVVEVILEFVKLRGKYKRLEDGKRLAENQLACADKYYNIVKILNKKGRVKICA